MAWEKKLNKQPASENANEDYAKHMWDRIQKTKNVTEQQHKIHHTRQSLKGKRKKIKRA